MHSTEHVDVLIVGAGISGTGRLLAASFSRVLDRMLRARLKPHIESRVTRSRVGSAR